MTTTETKTTKTANTAKRGLRSEAEIRAELRRFKAALEELARTAHDERQKARLEDIEFALISGELKKTPQGSVSVPLSFKGLHETSFEQVWDESRRTLKVQIATLQWALGKEWE